MTDKYGAEGEHDPAGATDMATEAETWQDDQPPIDDFADQPTEETATVSEETEGHEDEQTSTVMEKKRSLLLPVAAGLGGLLFLGAVLYWQFGASSSSTLAMKPPPLTTASLTPPSEVPATSPPGVPSDTNNPANVAPTTGLTPTDEQSPVNASPSNGVAMPASAPAAAPAAPLPTTLSAEVLTKAPPMPTPAPLSALPPPPAPSPVANAPGTKAGTKDTTVDERLSALTARVEDLQKSLAQTTQQLSQINNAIAAKIPLSPSAQPSSATEDRLNKMEQQLMQIQHAEPVTASSPVVTQETSTAVVADTTPEKPVTKSLTSSHQTKTSSHKSLSKKPKSSTAHAKSLPVHWVLRAATPDEAWVSTDATSADLRRIQVGDRLTGLGRIRSIEQSGDGWIVKGSEGSIY